MFGLAAYTFAFGGMAFWLPAYLERVLKWDQKLVVLRLGLTAGGQSTPSFYGDADVTDCSWFVDATAVSVYATDQAGQDLPEGAISGYLQSGGTAVPGADRGVAYATTNTDGSNVDLIVVKGQLGIELAASSPGVMTQAQAVTLGKQVAAALG